MLSESKRLVFDDILKELGGTGRFQLFVFVVMVVIKMFPSMISAIPLMAAFKQSHNCSVRENLTIPGNGSLIAGSCHIYRSETPNLKVDCIEWDVDRSIFETTIRSRYNLFCKWGFLAELSTTLFFLGFVVGSALYGLLSDRIGRLVTIVITGTHLSIAGMISSFAPNYWSYAILRFLVGIGNGGLLATGFTYMAEVSTKEHRIIFCLFVHCGFSLGVGVTTLIGYFIRDSVWNQFVTAVPILLVWVYPLMLPESPRWLYTTGRMARAEKAIKFVARMNRKEFTDELRDRCFNTEIVLTRFSDIETVPEVEIENKKPDSIIDIFRSCPLTVATITNWFSWFSVSASFFAVFYTLGDIGGNIFLSITYGIAIDFFSPLVILFVVKRSGRVPGLSLSFLIGALGCFCNAVLINYPSLKVVIQITSALAKFCFAANFVLIWAYSGELYPTVIRNVGVGVGSMWARIGGMLAPQASLLFDVWKPLPLILIGSFPFLSSILCFFLPETRNKKMLETNADMLRLVLHKTKLWRRKGMEKKEAEGAGKTAENENHAEDS